MRDGDFDASRLDEKAVTSEIREVNIGFNRMAQQLAKIEQDRAVMLAGISHDLRTPLAGIRVIDLTQANGMTLPQFSAFLASQDARLIQRNSFRQPSVWDFDLRLSKTFDLPYNIQLTILGEVFNVFNRNATVVTGANQDLFRITYTASTGKYTITKFTNTVSGTALNTFGVVQGYSSETIPRTLQLAAKIMF